MVLGYEHNLVKGKSGKHESGQVRLIQKRGKDVNITHDNVTVNTMFITPLQLSRVSSPLEVKNLVEKVSPLEV